MPLQGHLIKTTTLPQTIINEFENSPPHTIFQDISFSNTVDAISQLVSFSNHAFTLLTSLKDDVSVTLHRVDAVKIRFKNIELQLLYKDGSYLQYAIQPNGYKIGDIRNDSFYIINKPQARELLLEPASETTSIMTRYVLISQPPRLHEITPLLQDWNDLHNTDSNNNHQLHYNNDLMTYYSDPLSFFNQWVEETKRLTASETRERILLKAERKARKDRYRIERNDFKEKLKTAKDLYSTSFTEDKNTKITNLRERCVYRFVYCMRFSRFIDNFIYSYTWQIIYFYHKSY